MKGFAIAYGASTIVNAMATGYGGAFGVDTYVKAEVELVEDPFKFEVYIEDDPSENPRLAVESVKVVMEKVGVKMGAKVKTSGNIPIARGLKSSSAASNAIIMATAAALNVKFDLIDVARLSALANLRAGTSLTGAFDDACASALGNVYLTDNVKMQVVRKFTPSENLKVLFLVPKEKMYSGAVNKERVKVVDSLVKKVFYMALNGDYWSAMTLNGLIYCAVFRINPEPIIVALKHGAVAAGLSGKGPTICAVCHENSIDEIREEWDRFEGDLLEARVNVKPAFSGVKP